VRCWLLVLIAACDSGVRPANRGSASATGSSTPVIIVTRTEITYNGKLVVTDTPNSADCPASYPGGGACTTPTSCTYREGSCYCGYKRQCGGDPAPPDRQTTWQCAPATRADGCPGTQPADGAACAPDGKRCDYTCSCVATSTCTHGTWRNESGPCKP
jgi:hypothetical protein